MQKLTPQTEKGKLLAGDDPITKIVDRMQAFRDKPTTLAEAQEIDEFLSNAITYDMGKMTKEGKRIFDIQNRLRQTIENAADTDIVGGKQGFEALKKARGEWAKSLRMRDIERIIERAEYFDNPATAIRVGFRQLATPDRLRGYSKAEQDAIKKAAQGNGITDVLKTFGSRLGAIGAGVIGGPVGGALGYAGGAASRAGAEAIATKGAEKILRKVAQRGLTPAQASKMSPREFQGLPAAILTTGER